MDGPEMNPVATVSAGPTECRGSVTPAEGCRQSWGLSGSRGMAT